MPLSGVEATIFDVQRFSLHDGPGIRTVIFFKGCSLRCSWCQNPESISARPEMAVYAERCIGAGSCAESCPEDAILGTAGERAIEWSRCTHCGRCAERCPSEALRLVGTRRAVPEVLDACLADREFYEASGGGVTLSGGEPVLQASFLRELLPLLRAERVHVLLQTAGHYPWRLLEALLPWLDEVWFDWKLPEREEYAHHTGGDADRIAANLKSLLELRFPLRVRMPLVPGLNTDADSAGRTAQVLRGIGVRELHLLRYNSLWEAKLARLGTSQQPLGLGGEIDASALADAFAAHGLRATEPVGA
jgi:pyruvate formate lyase activating enzyme